MAVDCCHQLRSTAVNSHPLPSTVVNCCQPSSTAVKFLYLSNHQLAAVDNGWWQLTTVDRSGQLHQPTLTAINRCQLPPTVVNCC
jgi:hypothetical protein